LDVQLLKITQERLAAKNIVLNYVQGKHHRTKSHEEILERFHQGIDRVVDKATSWGPAVEEHPPKR